MVTVHPAKANNTCIIILSWSKPVLEQSFIIHEAEALIVSPTLVASLPGLREERRPGRPGNDSRVRLRHSRIFSYNFPLDAMDSRFAANT